MMKRVWMVMVCAGLLTMGGTVTAKPKPNPPSVTGGGIAQNFNAGPTFPDTFTHFAFSALATDQGVPTPFPPFSVTALDYAAKGQVELRNVLADDPTVTTSQLHGEVVCMASLGPSGPVDAGGNPVLGVWEIRFEITKLVINGEDQDLSQSPPLYGSIFVQDGGKSDFYDESFSLDDILNPNCLVNPFFELEPVINGNIVVHN